MYNKITWILIFTYKTTL